MDEQAHPALAHGRCSAATGEPKLQTQHKGKVPAGFRIERANDKAGLSEHLGQGSTVKNVQMARRLKSCPILLEQAM